MHLTVVPTVVADGCEWHEAVFARDGGICRAMKHDRRCTFRAEHAHHIVYRAHLIDEAMWIVENGIAVSEYCHIYAHATHNKSLPPARLYVAVKAVNLIHPQHLQRPPFDTEDAPAVVTREQRQINETMRLFGVDEQEARRLLAAS